MKSVIDDCFEINRGMNLTFPFHSPNLPPMHHQKSSMRLISRLFAVGTIIVSAAANQSVRAADAADASTAPAPLEWTAQQDHQNMKDQLGITRLRPGPSGRAGATNSANYDPAKANPYPDLPEQIGRAHV